MTTQEDDKLPVKVILNEACWRWSCWISSYSLVTKVRPCMPKRLILSCWIQTFSSQLQSCF